MIFEIIRENLVLLFMILFFMDIAFVVWIVILPVQGNLWLLL